jgi:phosphohistidine phosphatase
MIQLNDNFIRKYINKEEMMKKLVLIRHSKSSWKDLNLDDFDRPLNKRGKKNAPFMAQKLKEHLLYPDIFLSSNAKRAKTTAKIFKNVLKFDKKIIYDKNIYEASSEDLLTLVRDIDDKNNTAFLIGHNPSLNMFCSDMINLYENIPTTGIVVLQGDIKSWKDFNKNNISINLFIYPKKYAKI